MNTTAELALEDDAKAPAIKTGEVNELLWNKYTDKGEHVLMFNVPDVVGINSKRFCDAIAIGMWQSSGRLIQGFEVKVSRGDWLKEVKDVSKADPFIARCDRWWLISANNAARPEEIPACWGWMTATKHGLRIQKPAPPLPRDSEALIRPWAFALIRRAAEIDPERDRIRREKFESECERRHEEATRREISRCQPRLEEALKKIAKFETDSGLKMEDWRYGDVGKLARVIAQIREDTYGGYRRTLEGQRGHLARLLESTDAALAEIATEIDPHPEVK